MNIDSGEIRRWDELTDAERTSGRWVKLTEGEDAIAQRKGPDARLLELDQMFRGKGSSTSNIPRTSEDVKAIEGKYVFVNGGKYLAPRDRMMTYEGIVRLAGLTGTPTVVFKAAHDRKGQLLPGESFHIEDDRTSFSVAHTGNA